MPVTYDLNGKTALVTGGARGIGKGVARTLAASGARVHVWDVNPALFDGVSHALVDVTDRNRIESALAELLTHGPIDILVNSAGYLGTVHPFGDHERSDWRRIIAVNLIGTMSVTQAVLPHMQSRNTGRIVTMGSLAGKEGLAGLAAYSAASGGVVAFTKALGRELAETGIRVNCVAPGPIDTDMIHGLGPQAVAAMIADSPMKRLGRVEEVVNLVVWLCSDASDFNAGAVFDMSGGRARY